jgi:hypothetical protein
MDLMKRAIPAQARIWATMPFPALLDSRLRGNDGESSQFFLVTPLRGVTFFLALCAISPLADQYPAQAFPVF